MLRWRSVLFAGTALTVIVALVTCFAVTPPADAASVTSVEADKMTVTPFFGASVISNAAASGGVAISLNFTSTATATVTLPASSKVVVRAAGQQCGSPAPIMMVSLDGANIGSSSVTATSWTDYTATKAISAGSHKIGVSFTNQYAQFGCMRTLFVDSVTVVPAAVTTTTPTTTPGTPTGPLTTAPTADLAGWKHIFADDFTKTAAVGSWANPTDNNRIVYTGAQGQQWRTYPATYLDTYQHRPYRADQVLSVANGTLVFDLHNVDGQPAGANPSPIIANGSQYQTYGRYSARLRVDTAGLSEYYAAWLLWPQSEQWPLDGEMDLPEGALSGTASGFHHFARTAGGQVGIDTGAKFTDWHVYTIEWSPGRVRMLVDDVEVLNSTQNVPTKPMRWQLQTETNGSGTHRGKLLVDWVSVWSYKAP
ncbi:MAG: carbohydrate-binding domain-containing protein [Mycobacterium sp.]